MAVDSQKEQNQGPVQRHRESGCSWSTAWGGEQVGEEARTMEKSVGKVGVCATLSDKTTEDLRQGGA